MTDRITRKHLEGLCKTLNKITDSPAEPYTVDAEGKYHANIGCYVIDGAYGGWELERINNPGGGVTCPIGSGHVPARELYNRIHAYMDGLFEGMKTPNTEKYYQS
jgi:hypothetical protein